MSELKAAYQAALDAFVRQDFRAAVEGYRKAIEIDPNFALAYQGLAETHAKTGDLDLAVEAILKAIELEPEESLFHTSLSRFYQMQGRIPEAEEQAMIASRLQSQRGL